MGFRWVLIIVLLTSAAFTCINVLFLGNQLDLTPSSTSQVCDCDRKIDVKQVTDHLVINSTTSATSVLVSTHSAHKLAVIVPFRDRYEEMMEFVPHIHAFLMRQEVDHEMWIINQVDKHRLEYSSCHCR